VVTKRTSLALLFAALAFACNAVLGIDPPVVVDVHGDGQAAADAPADAAVETSPGSEAAPGVDAGNLLTNPSFEVGCTEGWLPGQAQVFEEDGVAHTGTRSCRICGVPGNSVWSFGQTAGVDAIPVGAQFAAAAWVRAPPDAGAAAPLSIALDVVGDNDTEIANDESAGLVPDSTWRRISDVVLVGDAGGNSVQVTILARSEDGCFLVDDVSLHPGP
jgi:hypothetical protein